MIRRPPRSTPLYSSAASDVYKRQGLFNTAKKGCVYIDNSTVSAEISRELYKAAKDKEFDFLDAPISGGQAGAEGGILTVMVGGCLLYTSPSPRD